MKSTAFIAAVLLAATFVPLQAGEIAFSPDGTHTGVEIRSYFEIRGTGERQNPIRRPLAEPYAGDELLVSYRLRYDGGSIDSPPEGDGEFLVLWLDSSEGGEASTHSGKVPNVGLHVDSEGRNRFMIRHAPSNERFGTALEPDREFLVVARLSKTAAGADEPFDRIDLWIDPPADKQPAPDATATQTGAISSVSWIGFSTGQKTETGDRILVGDLRLAGDWPSLFGRQAEAELSEIPAPPPYIPPAPPAELAEVKPAPESVTTDHWSFQPIRRPEVPKVKSASWVANPIDAFVARSHEREGLAPAPPADEVTLLRRLSLVLTGLPPSDDGRVDDVDDYVEKLLDSQAYGERWGRHWLDVARWAESNGHQHNRDRSHAWRYRDWVVKSFVEGKPFDDFLRQQIAGDELEPFAEENIVATGFLAAARYSGNELDKDIQRTDILVDIVNTTSKAFLGLTMECAQCHDHFFDPITQWDYYNLMAYFAQGQPGDVILAEDDTRAAELVNQHWGIFESVRDRTIARKREQGVPEPVLLIPKNVPKEMSPIEKRTFDRIDGEIRSYPAAWAFYSPVTSPHTLEFAPTEMRWPLPFQKESLASVQVRFLDRGEVSAPGPVAEPAWPLVFGGPPDRATSRPRTELAEWLVSPENPLTARVWANRIWQWHFGRGLVNTSGDFGVAGETPTHPELLDWLASELVDSGWSTRHIHRLILGSNTFRQGSAYSASNDEIDPDNALLWRWKPRRLEAEAIRDSLLAVAGTLDPAAGGPSVPGAESETSTRRSLYLHQRRDNLPHQQMLFDGANALTSCSKRRISTVGLQPLWMLNSDFVRQQAAALASRIEEAAASEDDPGSDARRLVRFALHREATPEEMAELSDIIAEYGLVDAAAVVLNTNEFVYIP